METHFLINEKLGLHIRFELKYKVKKRTNELHCKKMLVNITCFFVYYNLIILFCAVLNIALKSLKKNDTK